MLFLKKVAKKLKINLTEFFVTKLFCRRRYVLPSSGLPANDELKPCIFLYQVELFAPVVVQPTNNAPASSPDERAAKSLCNF